VSGQPTVSRQAVLLIPGLRLYSQGEILDQFVSSLANSVQSQDCSKSTDARVAGLTGKRITCTPLDSNAQSREIDVFEAYYADLIPDVATASPLLKLRQGTALMAFWFFSRIWLAFSRKIYLAGSGLVTALLLLLWYVSVLAVGLAAVGNLPVSPDQAVLYRSAEILGNLGESLGSWSLWLGLGTLLSVLKVGRLANMSNFVRTFLQDRETSNQVRARSREPLRQILMSGEYDRLTVVAHSFGTVIAVDLMSDFPGANGVGVRTITLGGAVAVFSYVSSWLSKRTEVCQQNRHIASWIDYSSPSDWLGDEMPFQSTTFPFTKNRIDEMGGWLSRMSGRTHLGYFHRREVMEEVIRI